VREFLLVTRPAAEPDRAVDGVARQPADAGVEHRFEEDSVRLLAIRQRKEEIGIL